ncbi:MAG: SurA N-terminal domain-containing protein, partial [Candidatus Omnitrophica bacterium]|nr:SurA N-terminal domain-containing protein [Candidatus Omnitrophota bacterium]
MLKQLRQKKTMKRLLWALAILIIPPFVFWGGGSALRSKQKGPDCAGMIFGKKISFETYSQAWQEAKDQALLMYGSKLEEMADSLNLEQQTWERLILLEEAKKKRIRVTDAEVIGTIEGFPFLQSRGKFDKRAYEMVLQQVFRTDPRQFEEGARNSIKMFKLRDSILSVISISDDEVKEAYKNENEKSKIAYILVSPAEFKDSVTVTPEDLKKYYDDNSESFRVPDQVNAEYLGFEFTNDAEKEKALVLAEKMDYALADKTKSFEDAAKENSVPIKETGFFAASGPIPQIGWLPELQKIAFGLPVGGRSSLIKSKAGLAKGFYIIRIKEKKPSYIPGFEEVKTDIESVLKEERAGGIAQEAAEKLYKEIAGAMKADNLKFAD